MKIHLRGLQNIDGMLSRSDVEELVNEFCKSHRRVCRRYAEIYIHFHGQLRRINGEDWYGYHPHPNSNHIHVYTRDHKNRRLSVFRVVCLLYHELLHLNQTKRLRNGDERTRECTVIVNSVELMSKWAADQVAYEHRAQLTETDFRLEDFL